MLPKLARQVSYGLILTGVNLRWALGNTVTIGFPSEKLFEPEIAAFSLEDSWGPDSRKVEGSNPTQATNQALTKTS